LGHFAIKYHYYVLLKYLLLNSFDLFVTNSEGMNCLHFAAKIGDLSAIQLIVENCNNVSKLLNIVDNQNRQPLAIAIEHERVDCVVFLRLTSLAEEEKKSIGRKKWKNKN